MCVVGVEVDVYGGDDDPLERGVGWVEEGEGHDVDGLGAAGQDGGVYVELELVYFGGLGPEALGALPVDEHALAGGAVQEEGVDGAGDAPRGVADAALGGVEAPLGRVDVRVDARLDLGCGVSVRGGGGAKAYLALQRERGCRVALEHGLDFGVHGGAVGGGRRRRVDGLGGPELGDHVGDAGAGNAAYHVVCRRVHGCSGKMTH